MKNEVGLPTQRCCRGPSRTRALVVMKAAAAGTGGSPGLMFRPLFECVFPDLTALYQ